MIVSYLHEHEIQQQALKVLNICYPSGTPIPVPIENIVELSARIELEFEEMVDHIDGYCEIPNKKIYINSSLEAPEYLHRMRFTIAHEFGHFWLHSQYSTAEIYHKNHRRMEIQANLFAAHILMPVPLFKEKWLEVNKTKNHINPTYAEIYSLCIELSNIFQVSIHAVEIHLKSIGIDIYKCSQTVTIQNHTDFIITN